MRIMTELNGIYPIIELPEEVNPNPSLPIPAQFNVMNQNIMNQNKIEQQVVIIDSQMLSSMQNCWREYQLRFRFNLKPSSTPDYFKNGSLLHHGLAKYYEGIKLGLPKGECKLRAMQRMHESIPELNIEAEAGNWLIQTIDQYCDFYKNDSLVPIAIEQPFAKIIYEEPTLKIIYAGVIDLLIQDKEHRKAVDHKSETRHYDPSDLDNQFMGYTESIEGSWFMVNKIGLQKTLKPEQKFRRYVIRYEKPRLNEWLTNTVIYVKEMLEREQFPMNLTSCEKFKGCAFRSFCRSIPAVRPLILEREYRVDEPWDPIKRLRKENE